MDTSSQTCFNRCLKKKKIVPFSCFQSTHVCVCVIPLSRHKKFSMKWDNVCICKTLVAKKKTFLIFIIDFSSTLVSHMTMKMFMSLLFCACVVCT
jgi:hypothetical protein